MLMCHILDNIIVNSNLQNLRFIDIGTSPNLLRISFTIVCLDAHFTLLDSLSKCVRFLRQVKHTLRLYRIEVIRSYVETFMS